MNNPRALPYLVRSLPSVQYQATASTSASDHLGSVGRFATRAATWMRSSLMSSSEVVSPDTHSRAPLDSTGSLVQVLPVVIFEMVAWMTQYSSASVVCLTLPAAYRPRISSTCDWVRLPLPFCSPGLLCPIPPVWTLRSVSQR